MSKTINKKNFYIGKHAFIPTSNGLDIEVIILDYIPSFGRDRFLVRPVNGKKQAKVEKLTLKKGK